MIGSINGYSAALLRAVQDSRSTSVLLSSLPSASDNFFPAPSRPALAPQGQSLPPRPSLALLETMQAGRQSSALLSSLTAPDPATGRIGGIGGFMNARADLAKAEEMVSATQIGQPSIADSRIAHKAYLAEIRARSQVEQTSMGSAWMQEWFA